MADHDIFQTGVDIVTTGGGGAIVTLTNPAGLADSNRHVFG